MRKLMNSKRKIISIVLAVLTVFSVCATFLSCEKASRGTLLATYDGGKVYESDVADWQNFFRIENISDIYNAENQDAMIAEVDDATTAFYVKLKAFRKLLEDKGIATITDSSIKQYAEEMIIPALEEKYADNGGYEFWRKSYNVSKNFVYDYAEEQIVTAYLEKYVMSVYGVTEQMIYDYWDANAYKYIVVPSYIFDVIMVSVASEDKADPEAWEAAKAEAQGYIDRIKAGEDFADVKADAIKNSKNSASSEVYSVKDSVPYTECNGFEDKEENLAYIDDYIKAYSEAYNVNLVEYADENGNAKEYALWFGYCNMLNEFYTKYSLLNLEVGETIDEPIRHIEGYEIIKLVEKSDKTEFQNPRTNETVYNDINDTLYEQLWDDGNGSAVDEFEEQLEKDYNIKIEYKYSENLASAN